MKKAIAMLFVILLLQGCVSAPRAPFVPSTGVLFTDIKAPLSLEFDQQKLIKTHGEASTTHVAYYILSFSVGDASLNKALKDGLLKKAAYVDYEWLSVLGVYGKLKLNAYGLDAEKEE